MKKCGKCKIEKDESQFYKNKSKKDGLSTQCKNCNKDYQNLDKYKQKKKEYKKKYQKSDNARKLQKKYRESDKGREYKKKYRRSDKYKESREIINSAPFRLKRCLGLEYIPTLLIPPELLELKKVQLKIKRMLKQEVKNEKNS